MNPGFLAKLLSPTVIVVAEGSEVLAYPANDELCNTNPSTGSLELVASLGITKA